MPDFLSYLKRPIYVENEIIRWKTFFQILFLLYIVIVPVALIKGLALEFIGYEEVDLKFRSLKFFISATILAPIIEEVLFRGFLKPNKNSLFAFLVTYIWLVIIGVIKNSFIIPISITIIFLIIFVRYQSLTKIQDGILKNFSLSFYLSCFVFGFIHIFNYRPLDCKLLLFSPFIVAPQVLEGFVLGYVRMRYGLIFSILFHSLMNIPPTIAQVLKDSF